MLWAHTDVAYILVYLSKKQKRESSWPIYEEEFLEDGL